MSAVQKVSFLDNQVVGVDDFNAILGDIAQEGVVSSDFDGTSAYQVSKMNVVTGNMVSQGVSASETSLACSVETVNGVKKLYVNCGLGIFGSGAKIKLTEKTPYNATKIEDIDNLYAYAYHDVKNNKAGFGTSDDGFPAEVEGEYYVLPLCQIADGVITDKRQYAKAKIRVCDTFNSVKKYSFTTQRESNYTLTLPVEGDRINFLVFASDYTIDKYYGVAIVTEPEYGVFKISSCYYDCASTNNSVTIYNSSNEDVYINNFRRGENGEILVDVKAFSCSRVIDFDIFASVYEEV